MDRGAYEALAFKAAQHPSESPEYLVTRVLAYCLEYVEGIAFSKGLAEPDEPAIVVRDLTGAYRAWIEIGAPSADRLHKASKAAPRVVVYTHRDPARLLESFAGERIHRREHIEVVAIPRGVIDGVVQRLDRRSRLGVNVSDGHLYVTVGDETFDGALERHRIP